MSIYQRFFKQSHYDKISLFMDGKYIVLILSLQYALWIEPIPIYLRYSGNFIRFSGFIYTHLMTNWQI